MSKVGPFANPFHATIKALEAHNIDTVEFMTYRMWDAVGYYDFHNLEETFIENLLNWILETTNVHVVHNNDGFYAVYTGDEDV